MTDANGAAIVWEDTVRLRLPADWTWDREDREGRPVAVLRPPGGAAVIHLLTETVPAPDSATAAVRLREMALRFVRPDDRRVDDRVVEDRPGGGLLAVATLRAVTDGRTEVHYLWFCGSDRDGRIAAVMASALVPGESDGDPAVAAILETLDEALRSATFV